MNSISLFSVKENTTLGLLHYMYADRMQDHAIENICSECVTSAISLQFLIE